MSDLSSSGQRDLSGRQQKQSRETQLLSDLAKGLDVQHHNTSLMHEFGAAFDAPQSVSSGTSGQGTTGVAPSPARSDHQHGAEVPTFIYPSFQNGWANFGGGWLPARYYKMNGRVWIEGLVGGGTFGNPIFTLSVGFRPLAPMMFVQNAANTFTRMNVDAAGLVYVDNITGNSNAWVTLNCNFYPGA